MKKNNFFCSTKSQGHVEMIISFVIFMGFVWAMFFFLNPLRENQLSTVAFERVQTKLMENLSMGYNYVSLILASSKSGCYSINLASLNRDENVLVTDLNGNLISSSKSGDTLNINFNGQTYYQIYFGNSFKAVAGSSNCEALSEAQYSFGILTAEKVIFSNSIANLNKSYIQDYKKLKSELRIDENFEFVVYNLSRNKIFYDTTSVHKLKTSTVISRDIPIRIIDDRAAETDILFNLRVWS